MDTDKDPECFIEKDSTCTCIVMSDNKLYGMKYDGTSVGSTALIIINDKYCYDGPLQRICEANREWSGVEVNPKYIFEGM